MMANTPEMVQQFGENYLHVHVQTNDEVVFDWNIELFELQRDGRYKSFTEVIRTVTFSPEKIRKSLSARFVNIVTIESDSGDFKDGSDNRTWFVCLKPGGPTLNDPGHRQAE
jgi:hypothetical protein